MIFNASINTRRYDIGGIVATVGITSNMGNLVRADPQYPASLA
jgi:hypothetical protein